jgi:hypothetical protein
MSFSSLKSVAPAPRVLHTPWRIDRPAEHPDSAAFWQPPAGRGGARNATSSVLLRSAAPPAHRVEPLRPLCQHTTRMRLYSFFRDLSATHDGQGSGQLVTNRSSFAFSSRNSFHPRPAHFWPYQALLSSLQRTVLNFNLGFVFGFWVTGHLCAEVVPLNFIQHSSVADI